MLIFHVKIRCNRMVPERNDSAHHLIERSPSRSLPSSPYNGHKHQRARAASRFILDLLQSNGWLFANLFKETIMITKSKSWYGRSRASTPFFGRPEINIRQATHMRMLKKAPYKVSYGEFTYAVQPVEEENVSYIAARMLTATGRLMEPLHEYELTRRFPDVTTAKEAWAGGFDAREDSFLTRALMERMIDEQAAEIIPAPPKVIPQDVPV